MKAKLLLLAIITISIYSCKSAQQSSSNPPQWYQLTVAEDVEIFIDTANIRQEGAIAYATEKRVFTTSESKKKYVDKIRDRYIQLGKPDKADKWNDFSYCIYECLYECTNKRFRIISLRDYDSTGKLIAESIFPSKKNIRWMTIEPETVGDYTFFYICDFKSEEQD